MDHQYSVTVQITPGLVAALGSDDNVRRLFYFCGNHRGTGLNGELLIGTAGATTATTTGVSTQRPEARSDFDQMCGSVGTVGYAAGASDPCSGAVFLCGPLSTPLHQCFDAADCKMATEMRTRIEATQDPIVTFMHQMVPHHTNVRGSHSSFRFQPTKQLEWLLRG
jgi:hypothetical protein